jgi:hypothetical protein
MKIVNYDQKLFIQVALHLMIYRNKSLKILFCFIELQSLTENAFIQNFQEVGPHPISENID